MRHSSQMPAARFVLCHEEGYCVMKLSRSHMNRSRTKRAAREMLTEELDPVLNQLQAVRAAARDPKGESLGVLVVQLGEAEDQLRALVKMARVAARELR